MELVAERLAVGSELREVHLLQQDGEDAIHRRVVRELHLLAFIAGGIPDVDRDHAHDENLRASLEYRTAIVVNRCGKPRGVPRLVTAGNPLLLPTLYYTPCPNAGNGRPSPFPHRQA